jgi:hypothetical protein
METTLNDILIYIGFAIVIVAGAIFLYRRDIKYFFNKRETVGTIINWMAASEKGKRYFYPMIEFSPDGITQQTFRADERCEGQPLYAPGTKVKIKFLPSDPEYRKVIYPS